MSARRDAVSWTCMYCKGVGAHSEFCAGFVLNDPYHKVHGYPSVREMYEAGLIGVDEVARQLDLDDETSPYGEPS